MDRLWTFLSSQAKYQRLPDIGRLPRSSVRGAGIAGCGCLVNVTTLRGMNCRIRPLSGRDGCYEFPSRLLSFVLGGRCPSETTWLYLSMTIMHDHPDSRGVLSLLFLGTDVAVPFRDGCARSFRLHGIGVRFSSERTQPFPVMTVVIDFFVFAAMVRVSRQRQRSRFES